MAGGQYILQAAEGSNQRRFEREENRKNRVMNKYQIDANIDLGMKQIESGFTLGMAGLETQRDIAETGFDVQFALGEGQLGMQKYGHDITKYGMDLTNQFSYDQLGANIDMFNVDAGMRHHQYTRTQDLYERQFDEIDLPRFQNEDRQIDFDFDRYKDYYEDLDQYYEEYLQKYEDQQKVDQQRYELEAERNNRKHYFLRDIMSGKSGFFESLGNSLYDVARVNIGSPLRYWSGEYNEVKEIPYNTGQPSPLSMFGPDLFPYAQHLRGALPMAGTDDYTNYLNLIKPGGNTYPVPGGGGGYSYPGGSGGYPNPNFYGR